MYLPWSSLGFPPAEIPLRPENSEHCLACLPWRCPTSHRFPSVGTGRFAAVATPGESRRVPPWLPLLKKPVHWHPTAGYSPSGSHRLHPRTIGCCCCWPLRKRGPDFPRLPSETVHLRSRRPPLRFRNPSTRAGYNPQGRSRLPAGTGFLFPAPDSQDAPLPTGKKPGTELFPW